MQGTGGRSPLLPAPRGPWDHGVSYGTNSQRHTILPTLRSGDHDPEGPPVGTLSSQPKYIRSRLGYRLFCLLVPTTLMVALHFYCFGANHTQATLTGPTNLGDNDSGAPLIPAQVQKLWGPHSPYRPMGKYKRPPRDCRLTQANILQRHGTRYPSLNHTLRISRALQRLQAKSYKDPKLQFLTNYKYDLGVSDLVPIGVYEQLESGRETFSRYPNLASEQNIPFIRASGNQSIIQSAAKWVEGFKASSNILPSIVLIPPHGCNNTIHLDSCPNALLRPKDEGREWRNLFATPIAHRLNSGARGHPKHIKKVNPRDVQYLFELCALETLAKETYSPFCKLFSEREFEEFEYLHDLRRFYSVGYGAPLGPVQSVGYINELLARLTDQPVRDNTSTNRTLDSNPETFPLGRGIYVDITHGSMMLSVVSAMGLFNDSKGKLAFDGGAMDSRKLDKYRSWVVSKITPFSAKLVVERMECGLPITDGNEINGIDDLRRKRETKRERKRETERQRKRQEEDKRNSVYVRVLMNDAVQVDICGGADEDGLCSLQSFVKSQEYAREDGKGDWGKCFE